MSYPNLQQLKSAMIRAKADTDNEVAELAGAVLGALDEMVQKKDIEVKTSAWANNTDDTTLAKGYKYRADVAVAGLHADDVTFAIFPEASLDITKAAKMRQTTDVTDGRLTFYAKTVPTANLTATVSIILGDFDSIFKEED